MTASPIKRHIEESPVRRAGKRELPVQGVRDRCDYRLVSAPRQAPGIFLDDRAHNLLERVHRSTGASRTGAGRIGKTVRNRCGAAAVIGQAPDNLATA